MPVRIREIARGDLDALAELVARANATYRAWAPPGWQPPGVAHERDRWRGRLNDPAAWNAVAVADGRPLGRAYTAAQLYTAAENARSRRFYERHGWLPGLEKRWWHGLLLIRYTLDVGQAPEAARAGLGAG